MHQGKELKDIADRQESVTAFAKRLNVSRDTLYKMYNRRTLLPKYVERLRTMGIHLTKSDTTKSYGDTILQGGASNGTGKHITESKNIDRISPYKHISNSTPMNELIQLSIDSLIALHAKEEDIVLIKAIHQFITYKQWAEGLKDKIDSLERENKLLREHIQDLKKK